MNPSAIQATHTEKRKVIGLYYGFQFTFTLLFWTPVFFEYQKRMGLSDPEIFRIQSLYYVAFCLLELPTGWVADRFGYVRSMAWGAVALILANVSAVYWTSFAGFVAHWALIAGARSFVSGAAAAYLYEYLRKTNAHAEFKRFEGNARAYSLFGKVFCFAVIGYLMAWKVTLPYWMTAAAGVVALGFALALPTFGGALDGVRAGESGARTAKEANDRPSMLQALRQVLASPWLLALMFQGVVLFVLTRVITVNLYQPILGGKGFGIEAYGVVMGAMTLIEAIGSARPSWMRRWFSDVDSVFVLSLAMGVCVVLFPLFDRVGTLVLFGVFSVAAGLSYPIQKQVMNEAITDSRSRATILSLESVIDRAVIAGVAAALEFSTHRFDAFLVWIGMGSILLMFGVQVALRRIALKRRAGSFGEDPSFVLPGLMLLPSRVKRKNATKLGLWAVLILSSLVSGGFPIAHAAPAWIRGAELVPADDPLREFVVHLRAKRKGTVFLCSGALIASDLVLTAAHCVTECPKVSRSGQVLTPALKPVDVRVSRKDLPMGAVDREEVSAREILVHPGYRRVSHCGSRDSVATRFTDQGSVFTGFADFGVADVNDLAVIRLARPLLGISGKPLPLIGIEEEEEIYASLRPEGLAASFGRHDFLREDYGRLNSALGTFDLNSISGGNIGIHFQNKIVSSGDSGAPVLVGDADAGYRLLGVISHKDQAFTESPVMLVRVTQAMDFLKQAMGRESAEKGRK